MYSGIILNKGIKSKIQIRRDQYAIPYIQAENEMDAWFGLGFAQGQDRAFQLEYYKRQANGALAEIFGERFLNADRYMRVIGLKRIAEKYVAEQDEKQREMLESFTAGVNAGIVKEGTNIDEAFEIIGCNPSLYEVSDVISTQLYFSLSLTHWLGKLTRYLILEKESPDVVDRLDPSYASWNYLIKPVGEKAGFDTRQLHDELVEVKKRLNTKGASNNWVLSGKKTASNHPLIANDPHLAADVPAPWYLASVQGPDFKICGACYPGSPIFFNGHNSSVAWAMTAAFIDNVDLYIEKMNEEQNATLVDGNYYPCEEIWEEIQIKNMAPHREKVSISRHGPVLTPAINVGEQKVSMCATWFKPKPINGFLLIQHAKDVNQVRALFRDWSFTSTNLVMADTTGNICWQLCGEIPDRKKTKGMLPLPGWDSSYDWNDTIIPYEKNPMIINPEKDFIATANNKHTKMTDEPYTGRDFIDGYRHRRVTNLLQSKETWSIEDVLIMQRDWYSGPWEDIKKQVLNIHPQSEKVKRAIEILSDWDGYMTPDSAATIIYEYFIAEMTTRIVTEIAPNTHDMVYETYNPAVGSACFAMSRISQIVQYIREQPEDLFDNKWGDVMHQVLLNAFQTIEKKLGDDINRWRWGDFRPLLLKHPINRNLQEFNTPDYERKLSLGPTTWGGDEQTLNVAAGSMLDPTVYPDFIPNLRSVMDVGNWDKNYFSLAGGQSSNPSSSHYRDLFDLWKDGKGIKIAWNENHINQVAKEELIIKPES